MSKKHPGFKSVARRIAAQKGIPVKNANAILASAGRKASPKAVKANPRLLKIKRGKA